MSASVVGVLGAGSWGTALAIHVASTGSDVRLWARDPEAVERMRRGRENVEYLPGVALPAAIEVTDRLADLRRCDPVLVVVPSHGLRAVVREFLAERPHTGTLVSASKGVEVETRSRMSEVLFDEAVRAGVEVESAVLSGPTFAAELAVGMPSAAVVAANDADLAAALCERFSSEAVRLYSSTDVIGVELGGATKNVIAIGAGLVTGLGLGHNTLAALITRGLHEITRLGVAGGGQPRTFSGLAGLGDLVLTCTGGLSRNRKAGIDLAGGATLDELQRGRGQVAEGVRNTRSIAGLAADLGVEMPITEQMEAVIYRRKDPATALRELMTRNLKSEAEL